MSAPTRLPGEDIVREGLADLRAGRESVAALVVAMAAPRLRALGFDVPASDRHEPASHRLYALLELEDPAGAHSSFNALARRIVSFADAADHARRR